ncbi:thioesterase family protein [Streptomyces phytohabitans]|uniref:thioesterase family protein n=1 Tax=Streptomyces phytohabitans TaxID=1150371 RepID=UPI00345C08F4
MSGVLVEFTERVRPEWIDYNGHLSEAYYVLVFGHATDAMMDATGLHAAYRDATGCSLYTAEAHVRYLREVRGGTELRVRTRVFGVDGKRLRFGHEMYAAGTGAAGTDDPAGTDDAPGTGDPARPVAVTELLGVHVGAAGATPFPADVRARFEALAEAAPEWAGRAIGPVPRG